MTSDWMLTDLFFEKTQGLKNTLMSFHLFHIWPESLVYPTCWVIYNIAVILSELTFRGCGKTGVFKCERAFIVGKIHHFWNIFLSL